MEGLIVPILWVLIVVVVILIVVVWNLNQKVSGGSGKADCCDQLEKWAKKQDAWIQKAYEHMLEQKKWIMQARSLACNHRVFLTWDEAVEGGPHPGLADPPSWCEQDPVDPPKPPCSWGTCEE
jgi:hypothetical protein